MKELSQRCVDSSEKFLRREFSPISRGTVSLKRRLKNGSVKQWLSTSRVGGDRAIDPQNPKTPIDTLILEALKQGDKNRGQLFDLTGKNYPLLVEALQHLKDRKLIETYFVTTGAIPVLTYRLHPGN